MSARKNIPCFKPPVGINVHPLILEIYEDLSAPLHVKRIRDRARSCRRDAEADLAYGYDLRMPDNAAKRKTETSLRDFKEFMENCLGVKTPGQYKISIELGRPSGCPRGAPEAFQAVIDRSGCDITASDPDGVRRALVWLEDEMTLRRAPFLPRGEFRRWPTVLDRISRSPLAPYRWLTGWELEYEHDYYPEAYLNRLMHAGVNGIWVAGLLRRLVASKTLPELGPRKHRLELLKKLIAKAGDYGIRVYLFCIEPRAVPRDHPVFAAHPDIAGAARAGERQMSLCTSAPVVRAYIREVMHELFTAAPNLAGIINIFCGERVTTCWYGDGIPHRVQTCPRCRMRSKIKVLAEDLNCFMEGIRSASSTAKLLAWTYSMDSKVVRAPSGEMSHVGTSIKPILSIMQQTHPDIIWLANFEHGGKKQLGRKAVAIEEYSLSYVGPSDAFKKIAGLARKAKRKCYAKTQLGTTYEMSSVPYLPLPGVVYDKISAMNRVQATGTMASWIIGGEPSVMLKALGEASCAPLPGKNKFLERLAAIDWGEKHAKIGARAWQHFTAGFNLYPFTNPVFYYGPITRVPAYKLHLERESQLAQPYNFGLERTRAIQPFEDQLQRWCGNFSPEELVRSFRAMHRVWDKGLALMEKELQSARGAGDLKKQLAVARAAGIKFASTANVIEFYYLRDRLRERGRKLPASENMLVNRLLKIVADDIRLAGDMQRHLRVQASIGFESEIYAYSFSRELIDEKIAHARKTLARLKTWRKSGVEYEVLERILPVRPPNPDKEKIQFQIRLACLKGD